MGVAGAACPARPSQTCMSHSPGVSGCLLTGRTRGSAVWFSPSAAQGRSGNSAKTGGRGLTARFGGLFLLPEVVDIQEAAHLVGAPRPRCVVCLVSARVDGGRGRWTRRGWRALGPTVRRQIGIRRRDLSAKGRYACAWGKITGAFCDLPPDGRWKVIVSAADCAEPRDLRPRAHRPEAARAWPAAAHALTGGRARTDRRACAGYMQL